MQSHSENEEEDKEAGDMKYKVIIAEKAAAEQPNPRVLVHHPQKCGHAQ